MKNIYLSPSSLNLFRECNLCFWREKVQKIKRPRGIFPSLPGALDLKIKIKMDAYRLAGYVPPALAALGITALYPDQARLNQWRHWKSGLKCALDGQGTLSGAVDDIVCVGNTYAPFDYKTKGTAADEAYLQRYYQNQVDCYALMMHENELPTAGFGVFGVFSPLSVQDEGIVHFAVQMLKIDVDPERARRTCLDAIDCLNGPEPLAGQNCEYCNWIYKNNGRAHGL